MFALTPVEWEILRLSLKVAFWSVLCSLPLAVAVAMLLARCEFAGKSLFDAVVHLPLVLPPVVIGYFLLLLLGRRGPLGALLEEYLGIVVAFRWTGAAVAAGIMGFPLMMRAIRLSIEAIDTGLEAAARTLGATRARVFVTITLPLALPGILTGALLSFARGLGEFGATITFVSNIPGETRTLPLAIYTLTQVPGGDAAALRLSLIAIVLSVLALMLSEYFVQRAQRRAGARMLRIDIGKQLANFELNARFASDAGITALFGRSGAGKTTLVNAIAGLVRPDRGSIEINGDCLFDSERGIDVAVERRRIGYVFQDGRLFPHLTVRGNLNYGYALALSGQRHITFKQIVDLLGLEYLLDRRPANLSGGEKQRVAIGRALLASPRVLLMDEPLAALDNLRKDEILRYIECLHEAIEVPIVYVTHAVEEILRLAETVVLMAEGKVLATGKPSEVMGRAELRAHAGIFEGGTVIDAKVVAHDLQYDLTTLEFSGGRLTVPGLDALPGEAMRLRIRARDVSIALTRPNDISLLNVLHGHIVEAMAGSDSSCNLRVDVGGVNLAARITRLSADRLRLQPGREVYAMIKAISLDR